MKLAYLADTYTLPAKQRFVARCCVVLAIVHELWSVQNWHIFHGQSERSFPIYLFSTSNLPMFLIGPCLQTQPYGRLGLLFKAQTNKLNVSPKFCVDKFHTFKNNKGKVQIIFPELKC